ncbi:MAG: PLP-dependent transferase [Lentisphaerae bacterium]|nr:PLP-dependent transferase [Lentisphaerota bacterium]
MTTDSDSSTHFGTRVVHSGKIADTAFNSVMPPLYPSSTFAFDRLGENKGFDYTRSGNPTRKALEDCLANLEGGVDAVCTGTGMSAVTGILHLLQPGDHVIAGHDIYGGTYRLMHDVFAKLGINFSFVEMVNPENVRKTLTPATRMVWIETPSNPMLKLADIAAITAIAKTRDAITVVDNTFLSPVFQQPLSLGVDIVMHSTTKYINGHSDVVGGVIISRTAELAERIRYMTNALGLTESPWDAWLVLRGVRTLPHRMRAHATGAQQLAEYLSTHPQVVAVHYPGLPSHPQYALAQQQMTGYGGVVTFEVDTDKAGLDRLFGALKLYSLAESLGGVESLIESPWYMSHMSMSETARTCAGIHTGTIRVSVGIEDPADLIEDLNNGLRAMLASFATGQQ